MDVVAVVFGSMFLYAKMDMVDMKCHCRDEGG